MTYVERALKLEQLGVAPKDIPATLNFFEHGVYDIPETAMSTLYDYFLNNGDMPYGTAKARTGDPDNWIVQRLEYILKY